MAINGESAAEMLNVEAQNKIKQSPGQLQLQVERWVLWWGGWQLGHLGPQPQGRGVPAQAGVPSHVCAGCFSPPATLGAVPSPREPVSAL